MCEHSTYSYVWIDGKLQPIDQCISLLVLQLNLAGIRTVGACCGHGKGYPNITCVQGTEEKLRKVGCKIIVPKQNGNVEAYFPVDCWGGKTYPVQYSPWRGFVE